MSFQPEDYCVNCEKQYQYHVDGKCPFEASTFEKREGWVIHTEEGIGIGNTRAINKIQFFDISVVNSPYVPSAAKDPQ